MSICRLCFCTHSLFHHITQLLRYALQKNIHRAIHFEGKANFSSESARGRWPQGKVESDFGLTGESSNIDWSDQAISAGLCTLLLPSSQARPPGTRQFFNQHHQPSMVVFSPVLSHLQAGGGSRLRLAHLRLHR